VEARWIDEDRLAAAEGDGGVAEDGLAGVGKAALDLL